MYNWYWLLVLILGILQPTLSEHIVIDGRQCCLHSSRAPPQDENASLDRKYHVDDGNSRLNIERGIRQIDRRYERRDGQFGTEDTRLSVERHVERQIFAPTDHSRSQSRTNEVHGRRVHRTFRDVRPEPQIRTYLESREVHRKNIRLQDRSTEPRQVLDRTLNQRIEIKNLDHNSHEADRINRNIRRTVLNEDIAQKQDTERDIGRTQYRISEARRNDDELFRNTVRYSRDNIQRKNSVSQQRVRQIEDGKEHITSRLDRSHKLFKRGTSQMSERTPDRNTNLRSEHINTRRIEMDISRQRSVVLNRGLRQSEERHSRMGETKNLRFDSTDTRINKRVNSKFGAIDERDRSEQSSRRVMGGFTSRNREDQIRNPRSERMNIRNRERFVRENSPANYIPIQRELARQSFLREVDNNHDTDRNDYSTLNVRRDYRNNERLTRDTSRTVFSHPELRYNERSDSAVCQMREMRNTCARVQKTDGTRAERYDDERKVARSVDRTVLSDRFTDQIVRRGFRRQLSIRGNDISVKQNLRPSGVRKLTIESTSRNREQRNSLMRDKDSNSDTTESIENNKRERFIALDRNVHRQKLRINDGRITRRLEIERQIIRQKRSGFRNYEKIGSAPILQNERRTLVTRFVRSREQLEANSYEIVQSTNLDAKRISSVQYSRNDNQNKDKRNISFRNNSRYSKIDSREKTFIMERNVDTVNINRFVPSQMSRMQEKDLIRDNARSKKSIERYARDNNRDSTNAVSRDFRTQSNKMFASEEINDNRSDSNTHKRTNIGNNRRNTLRFIHETRQIDRNLVGSRIFRTSGGYAITEEYRYNRNHERNYKHAVRHVSLEPSVRRLAQNREERGINRGEERKDVLNNKRDRSLSVDSFKTQSQTRNNDGREIVKNRENDYNRIYNRYSRDENDRPILVRLEITKTGLRNVKNDRVIQNREARETNTYQERRYTKNMENRILREITDERNLNTKDERRNIDEDQMRTNNQRIAMIRHTTRAREERHANIRDEERRQFRTAIQRREMNEEFTRLNTELATRRTNVKNVRDVENWQRSALDMYREFRKVDMERGQSRRNIEFAYMLGTRIIPTKSYSTDSKSIENSYFSFFYWQYLFYAIQGFYIFYVFKQMLREIDTAKNTSFMGWTSQRVIKVD